MIARATSWPAPVAFEESTAVRQLVALTRDPDAGIVAIRLWQHRRRCGPCVPGPDADATLETIAGNGRRRRGVAVHLRAAGFVEDGPAGSVTIRTWETVAFVDWTRAGSDDADESPSEDKAARKRRLARERAQRKRDASVTPERDASRSKRDEPATERDASVTPSVTERDESAVKGSLTARAHLRTATGTETVTETKSEVPPPAAAAAGAPSLPGIVLPPGTRVRPPPALDRGAPAKPRPKAERPRNADMDAVLATYERVYRPPPGHVWSAGEAAQFAASRKRWDVAAMCRALERLAAEEFNRKLPLVALLEPGKLETGMRDPKGAIPKGWLVAPDGVNAQFDGKASETNAPKGDWEIA